MRHATPDIGRDVEHGEARHVVAGVVPTLTLKLGKDLEGGILVSGVRVLAHVVEDRFHRFAVLSVMMGLVQEAGRKE
jgi:hypothetical protein